MHSKYKRACQLKINAAKTFSFLLGGKSAK